MLANVNLFACKCENLSLVTFACFGSHLHASIWNVHPEMWTHASKCEPLYLCYKMWTVGYEMWTSCTIKCEPTLANVNHYIMLQNVNRRLWNVNHLYYEMWTLASKCEPLYLCYKMWTMGYEMWTSCAMKCEPTLANVNHYIMLQNVNHDPDDHDQQVGVEPLRQPAIGALYNYSYNYCASQNYWSWSWSWPPAVGENETEKLPSAL